MFRKLAATGLLLILGVPIYAQRTTGNISGVLRDTSGAVLPGVTVSVTGPNIVGTMTAVTNEVGAYRVMNLPPGDYQVSFALIGFKTLNRKAVRVSLGQQAEENANLEVSQLHDAIDVVAESSVVDTSSNELGSNYDREWVDNAPLKRFSFFDLVAAAPGSVQVGSTGFGQARTMVYGSSYDENSFQLDGTDITDNFFNEALSEPNMDAIEEIEVLSLGAPAEYGNLTGAVYNIVTRQGTNDFHGDLNFYYQSDGLTGRNTTQTDDGGFPFRREKYNDFSAQLAGPIVKDKLWFFGSYQYQRDGFTPVGVDPGQFAGIDETDRYMFKLNWQLSANHKVQANFHYDKSAQPYAPGPTEAPSTYFTRRGKTPTPGVSYTGVLSNKTTLDVRYSGFYGTVEGGPSDPNQPKNLPRIYNLDTGEITGGHYYYYDLQPTRTSVTAKVTHFADDFLGGSHDFRFGVQYTAAKAGGVYGYNDLIFTYDAGGTTYGYGYQRTPFSYNGQTRGVGVFLDDTFKVSDRFSLNLGLRYDWNKAFAAAQNELDADGNPTGVSYPKVDLYTWTNFSPRLGFNLKLTSDGKTVLKGHWGRYHRAIATGEFANVVGPNVKPYFFGLYDAGTGGLVDLEQISSNENLSVSSSYSSPYTDQYILTVEHELLKGLGVNASYIYKKGRNFAAWQDFGGLYTPVSFTDDLDPSPTGATYTLQQLQNSREDLRFEITNRDEMKTDIHAVTVGFLRRMSGRWQLNASVTYLRSTGRLGSSNLGSDASQRGGLQFQTFGRDPNDFVNTGGRLKGDIPWSVKAQFLYKLPANFLFGVNYNYRTGANKVRRARVGDITNLSSTILLQPRGTYERLPDGHFLDVRLSKEFKLSKTARVGVYVDGFNLLNEDTYETVLSSLVSNSTFDAPDGFVLPRRMMIGAKLKF
jgi:outer membrane receptor protein involved in Fe transport